jgi:hypothetical protein
MGMGLSIGTMIAQLASDKEQDDRKGASQAGSASVATRAIED